MEQKIRFFVPSSFLSDIFRFLKHVKYTRGDTKTKSQNIQFFKQTY